MSGTVRDLGTNVPLASVHIYLQENNTEVITDSTGRFRFDSLCPGLFHLNFSHANCDAQDVFIQLEKDTQFLIYLDHSYHVLKGAALKGDHKVHSKSRTISEQGIEEQLNENLGNILNNLSGVRTLKTGNAVSKPIINGLYGNRIVILNNGVPQAGQQWGSDHSPEIDPLSAYRIRVLQGADVLHYFGNTLGGTVLLEQRKLSRDPHLHGKIRKHIQTNGRGFGAGFLLEKGGQSFAWRVNANIKKVGHQRAANYFLTNSGIEEANGSILLEKNWSAKSFTRLYLSTFNSELGILRGSHIGNTTDLTAALNRNEPFFTSNDFSYQINAPRQMVNHQLIKLGHKYFVNDSFLVSVNYAMQWNKRKEFDVRRGGRTQKASLSLDLQSHFVEWRVNKSLPRKWKLVTGYQFNFATNVNDPETGILPLIPDYIEVGNAGFITASKNWCKSQLELGARFNFINQNVATITNTIPRKIERFNKDFQNLSSVLKYTYQLGDNKWELSHALGFAMRNPAINELYSGGLHQGVSGIELGSINLKQEVLLKGTSGVTWNINDEWFAELSAYWQQFNNYIYLEPLKTFSLTVRGAFPVFQYKQVDAHIYGLDAMLRGELHENINVLFKTSLLRGRDLSNQLPLINIPAGMAELSLFYTASKHLHLNKTELENMKLGIVNTYVLRQTDVLDNQDFLPAPPAYYLLSLEASTDIQFKKVRWHLYARLNNALNSSYRDYLNRQRYFADELGINFVLGGVLKF
jgi:iron complex outermembrane receptor protein